MVVVLRPRPSSLHYFESDEIEDGMHVYISINIFECTSSSSPFMHGA